MSAETLQDAAEWLRLEQERTDAGPYYEGPTFSNKPHARSAYAHLPMRGCGFGKYAQPGDARKAGALWPELNLRKLATAPKKDGPHRESYRPDLPLRGFGLNRDTDTHKWTLSAEEKRELAKRPLRYVA